MLDRCFYGGQSIFWEASTHHVVFIKSFYAGISKVFQVGECCPVQRHQKTHQNDALRHDIGRCAKKHGIESIHDPSAFHCEVEIVTMSVIRKLDRINDIDKGQNRAPSTTSRRWSRLPGDPVVRQTPVDFAGLKPKIPDGPVATQQKRGGFEVPPIFLEITQ